MYENHANQATMAPIGRLRAEEAAVDLAADPDIEKAYQVAGDAAYVLEVLRRKRDRLDNVIAEIEKKLDAAADRGPQPPSLR